MAVERLAEQAVVLAQSVRVAVTELLEQSRGPFDVGGEEGDGGGRELRHYLRPRLRVRATRAPLGLFAPGRGRCVRTRPRARCERLYRSRPTRQLARRMPARALGS